jgi:hypothetical protein
MISRYLDTDASGELHVIFGGDFSLRQSKRFIEPGCYSKYPADCVQDLLPIFDGHHLSVLNLETVLLEDGPSPAHPTKRGCGFDSPPQAISVLQRLGINAVSLGNNHSMDFGPHALIGSIEHLEDAGITVFGAGRTLEAARAPIKIDSRIGSIYLFGGLWSRRKYKDEYLFYAEDGRAGVNCLEQAPSSRFLSDIQAIRHSDPTALLIAFPHWGASYRQPYPRMRKLNEQMFAAGIDLVIGHGTHNLQSCGNVAGKISIFSLGNLFFNSRGNFGVLNAFPFSGIVSVSLGRRGGRWVGLCRLYPILSDNELTEYRPRPASEAQAVEIWKYLNAQEPDSFSRFFALDCDARGWHFAGQVGH